METNSRSLKAIEKHWPGFTEHVRARLHIGAAEYGDRSLDLEPSRLLEEIEQELYDVMGWGFIVFLKLQDIREKLNGIPVREHAAPKDHLAGQ